MQQERRGPGRPKGRSRHQVRLEQLLDELSTLSGMPVFETSHLIRSPDGSTRRQRFVYSAGGTGHSEELGVGGTLRILAVAPGVRGLIQSVLALCAMHRGGVDVVGGMQNAPSPDGETFVEPAATSRAPRPSLEELREQFDPAPPGEPAVVAGAIDKIGPSEAPPAPSQPIAPAGDAQVAAPPVPVERNTEPLRVSAEPMATTGSPIPPAKPRKITGALPIRIPMD